jgi:acyl carrier protein
MSTQDRLLQLVAKLFQAEAQDLSLDLKPGDLPRWDSLGHISLIEEVQKEFSTEIPLEIAMSMESLHDLLKAIGEAG